MSKDPDVEFYERTRGTVLMVDSHWLNQTRARACIAAFDEAQRSGGAPRLIAPIVTAASTSTMVPRPAPAPSRSAPTPPPPPARRPAPPVQPARASAKEPAPMPKHDFPPHVHALTRRIMSAEMDALNRSLTDDEAHRCARVSIARSNGLPDPCDLPSRALSKPVISALDRAFNTDRGTPDGIVRNRDGSVAFSLPDRRALIAAPHPPRLGANEP